MSDIKRMSVKEFCDEGYLQEANRVFFHPLGLALGVTIDEPEATQFGCEVWDYRDDSEGMQFGVGEPDTEWDLEAAARKAENVEAQRKRVLPGRRQQLGFDIEPIPGFHTLWDVDVPTLDEETLMMLLEQCGEAGE